MRIFLVRHGATADTQAGLLGGAPDHALSPTGIDQVKAIGRLLSPVTFAQVYSSNAVRCRQTAEAIIDGRAVHPVIEPRLRELDFGALDGLTWKQAAQCHPGPTSALITDPLNFQPPRGEPMRSLRARVEEFLAELSGADPVLLVSHAGPIKLILLQSLGMDVRNATRLWVDPASISVVDRDENGPVVRCVNQRAGPGAVPGALVW